MASDTESPVQPSMDRALDSLQTSFDNSILPPIPSQHITPQSAASMSAQRRRRRSLVSGGLRRSVSTPNVRGSAACSSHGSSADKRGGRNKLGYHRTSIACSHCRRRKIRCLVANEDPQQRCANCIKLKKECSFLPVDHPPNVERRPRTGSRIGTTSGEGSASSSPPIGGVMDHVDNFNHFAPLPMSNRDYPPLSNTVNASAYSPHGRARYHSQPYELVQQPEQAPWDSPYLEQGPLSAGNSTPDDPSRTYWRSPLTPAFPTHFSGPPTSSSGREFGGSFTSFAPPANPLNFPLPPRSMSVHGGQDYHQNYQSHYNPGYESDLRRRASEMMHPPSLQASRNSSNASMSEASGTPSSLPATNQWGIPQANWTPLPGQALSKPHDIGWYSPEPGLPQVQEEDVPPPFGSPPAVLYSDGAPA